MMLYVYENGLCVGYMLGDMFVEFTQPLRLPCTD